jgi:hypothetical protein
VDTADQPKKGARWVTSRYYGKYCPSRNDKWVFGNRDTGAYLPRHSWTSIRRHVMVKNRASPDDPDLADKGYQGSTWAKVPYKGKNKPESQKQANRAHAKLRAPGERANAQFKTWKILGKLRCCPWHAGQIAKAIRALQICEAQAG